MAKDQGIRMTDRLVFNFEIHQHQNSVKLIFEWHFRSVH